MNNAVDTTAPVSDPPIEPQKCDGERELLQLLELERQKTARAFQELESMVSLVSSPRMQPAPIPQDSTGIKQIEEEVGILKRKLEKSKKRREEESKSLRESLERSEAEKAQNEEELLLRIEDEKSEHQKEVDKLKEEHKIEKDDILKQLNTEKEEKCAASKEAEQLRNKLLEVQPSEALQKEIVTLKAIINKVNKEKDELFLSFEKQLKEQEVDSTARIINLSNELSKARNERSLAEKKLLEALKGIPDHNEGALDLRALEDKMAMMEQECKGKLWQKDEELKQANQKIEQLSSLIEQAKEAQEAHFLACERERANLIAQKDSALQTVAQANAATSAANMVAQRLDEQIRIDANAKQVLAKKLDQMRSELADIKQLYFHTLTNNIKMQALNSGINDIRVDAGSMYEEILSEDTNLNQWAMWISSRVFKESPNATGSVAPPSS